MQDRLPQDVPGRVLGKSQALQGARRLQQVQEYVCAAALDRFDASGVFQRASALAELPGTSSAKTSHNMSAWRRYYMFIHAHQAVAVHRAQLLSRRQQLLPARRLLRHRSCDRTLRLRRFHGQRRRVPPICWVPAPALARGRAACSRVCHAPQHQGTSPACTFLSDDTSFSSCDSHVLSHACRLRLLGDAVAPHAALHTVNGFPMLDYTISMLPLSAMGQRALRQAHQACQPRRPCRRASASAARHRRRARRQARHTSSPATWPRTTAARCRPRRRRLRPPPARPRWVLPSRLLFACMDVMAC